MKVKLGEIAVLINGDRGKNYPSQADIVPNGEIPFVNAGHLNGRNISFDEMNYISQEKYEQLNSGKFFKGDILYCLRGSLGKKAAVKDDVKGAIASSLVIIRPDSEKVDVDYLMFALDSPSIQEQLLKANNGSSQPNLSAASVRAYDIDLPGKEIQEEVVAKLSKVRTIIDARQQELQKLDELIKARFVEMFGDPIVNSKHLPTIRGDLFFKLSNGKFVPEEKRFENGVPVYGGNGISWYTDEILVDTDTLVVGRVGFQSGNVHYAKGPLWVSDNAMYISNYNEEDYDLLFLCHLMEHIDFTRHQDAGDLKKITQKPFMAMEYIHPSLQQQQEYTAFVQQVDKSKVAVQAALDKVQLLFDSLMQEYFG